LGEEKKVSRKKKRKGSIAYYTIARKLKKRGGREELNLPDISGASDVRRHKEGIVRVLEGKKRGGQEKSI